MAASSGAVIDRNQSIELNHHLLVGGFNPFEKYQPTWESFPSRDENKKYLKPPPSLYISLIYSNPLELLQPLPSYWDAGTIVHCFQFQIEAPTFATLSWTNCRLYKIRELRLESKKNTTSFSANSHHDIAKQQHIPISTLKKKKVMETPGTGKEKHHVGKAKHPTPFFRHVFSKTRVMHHFVWPSPQPSFQERGKTFPSKLQPKTSTLTQPNK